MDRTGNSKIGIYMGIWLLIAIVLSAGVFLFAVHEEKTEQERLTGLLVKHPELEAELVSAFFKGSEETGGQDADTQKAVMETLEEKYGYDSHPIPEAVWYLWGFLMLFSILFMMLLFSMRQIQKNRQEKVVLERLMEFYEQLEEFCGGNFCVEEKGTDEFLPERWRKLWEILRELGAYFQDLKERLQKEENSTKELITNISHQLKTPLSSLRISHELILSETVTEQERQEFLRQEEQEIYRLETLLSELVNLSRLESHMIQLKPEPALIKPAITEAVSRIYGKAHKKQIEIQVEMDQEPVKAAYDRKWTIEAFVNVLDNAVKYSGENTLIQVRVNRLAGNLLVEVEDEGIGIPAKELHKIYQRFYRGEKAGKLVKDGAGVGLYLARSILEQQGGTIFAKRKENKGSIFKMTLPVCPEVFRERKIDEWK